MEIKKKKIENQEKQIVFVKPSLVNRNMLMPMK
jgi:hypothetical protein